MLFRTQLYLLTTLVLSTACTLSSDPLQEVDPTSAAEVTYATGSCSYRNVFSGEPECREYTGSSWTTESASENCQTGITGADFVFAPDTACALEPILGTCRVGSEDGLDYTLFVGGEDEGMCTAAELACVNFASGDFIPASACIEDTDEDSHTAFIWPYETCQEPLADEPAGTRDGQVCVLNSINGCTEEGRDFRDYASCDVVRTNRPYYPAPGQSPGREDDERLNDTDYMQELSWVRSQVESCACICCHSEKAVNGPAKWSVDSAELWVDMMSDDAIGMFAGYIDSSALGYYDPEINNGFNRHDSGMPTTDVERMVGFFIAEFDRRNLRPEDMSEKPPIGGPLVDQANYILPDCDPEEGVDDEGRITWLGDDPARYIYILEAGSANPGVPPNYDLPEGTIWRLDVGHQDKPVYSGLHMGDTPENSYQVFPAPGVHPSSLVSGNLYHLYVLFDVAMPIARCVFEAP